IGKEGIKKGSSHAILLLEFNELPLKQNLPMVYPPQDWSPRVSDVRTLSDLKGGYLCGYSGDVYNSVRLLSSHDLDHFYIQFDRSVKNLLGKRENHRDMCRVLNHLQNQAFEVNTKLLDLILDHSSLFEELGLLMPRFLANVPRQYALEALRSYCFEKGISGSVKLESLLKRMLLHLQKACYENFI
ncbi:hypothetical protein K8353_41310, partial [Burkholderia contaminans]|nr:hypothetical protein [Burkholderia contaminans]